MQYNYLNHDTRTINNSRTRTYINVFAGTSNETPIHTDILSASFYDIEITSKEQSYTL